MKDFDMEDIIITIPVSEIDGIVDLVLQAFLNTKYPQNRILLYFLLNNVHSPDYADPSHPNHALFGKGEYTYEQITIFKQAYSGLFKSIEIDRHEFTPSVMSSQEMKLQNKKVWRKEILLPLFNKCFDQWEKAQSLFWISSDYLMRDGSLLNKFNNTILEVPDKSVISDLMIDITQMAENPNSINRVRTHFYKKEGNSYPYLRLDEVKPGQRASLVEYDYISGQYFFPHAWVLSDETVRFDPNYCDNDFEMKFIDMLREKGFKIYGLINTLNLHLKYPQGLFYNNIIE